VRAVRGHPDAAVVAGSRRASCAGCRCPWEACRRCAAPTAAARWRTRVPRWARSSPAWPLSQLRRQRRWRRDGSKWARCQVWGQAGGAGSIRRARQAAPLPRALAGALPAARAAPSAAQRPPCFPSSRQAPCTAWTPSAARWRVWPRCTRARWRPWRCTAASASPPPPTACCGCGAPTWGRCTWRPGTRQR
jgi:hypothetical protein